MDGSPRPAAEDHSIERLTLADVAQAHIGRASRFANGKTRDWSVFYFFRIMSRAEITKDIRRLKAVVDAATGRRTILQQAALRQAVLELLGSFEDPELLNAGLVRQAMAGPDAAETLPDAPSELFLEWIRLLVDAKQSRLGPMLKSLLGEAGIPARTFAEKANEPLDLSALLVEGGDQPSDEFTGWLRQLITMPEDLPQQLPKLVAAFKAVSDQLSNAGEFLKIFEVLGGNAAALGRRALSHGLAGICAYDLLRQVAPKHVQILGGDLTGIVRSEASIQPFRQPLDKEGWDPVPINLTFTYPGLKALKLDDTTLATFPEAFKDGMAARAERLGDTGPSAPEHWSGTLGLDCIHGYFTGGFLVGDELHPVKATLWQSLREEVRAFNTHAGQKGRALRLLLGGLFRMAGLQIVHIELGEDPYDVDNDGNVQRLPYRREHFGFRDGISQPFVDMGLADPPAGSGTPARNRTWAPVAPGEIYLHQPDEDKNIPQQPLPEALRLGSTFLVFRKLEQDVPGFRTFLSRQRPHDTEAQEKLAAEFVGRWKNGTPLVLAPDAPLDLGSDPDGLINNFLYVADDPAGGKCPLGAHVRRTNPRDIGGNNDVRRHRILRRSIGYGGPLLPPDVLGDGNTRGLLFIAANSRIDLQFEVVQANWINKGEFLGQAGLGRCPVTGANLGGPSDSFLEAGALAPVVDLPRFVITRGGDYFFAPGIIALIEIALGNKFKIPPKDVPYLGFSMGDAKTPMLFSKDRIKDYTGRILLGAPRVITVELPQPLVSTDPQAAPVAFVGWHEDVCKVLSENKSAISNRVIFSIAQYQEAGRRISRGYDLIIGTERHSPTGSKHRRMHAILDDAWKTLDSWDPIYPRLARVTKGNIELALRRTSTVGTIDLIHDLPSTAVYGVVEEIFGTPGPGYLTEIALALPFARQHFGELHPDWLAALKGAPPDNPGLATMQIWSILLFADIVGNVVHQQEVMALSLQAGSEFLTQLDLLMAAARARPVNAKKTLLDAFFDIEGRYVGPKKSYRSSDEYYADVRMILMELAGSAIAIIPTAFGSIMDSLLSIGDADLPNLIPVLLGDPQFISGSRPLTEDGVARLIFETTRLNPTFAMLMRRCAQNTSVGSYNIAKGHWIAALVAAANLDPRVWKDNLTFSLAPFLPGPPRDIDKYLLFGVHGGGRECWGRDRLALYVLKECVKAAGRLQGMRRVAGDGGKLQTLVGVNVGLNARFGYVLDDWDVKRKPKPPPPTHGGGKAQPARKGRARRRP